MRKKEWKSQTERKHKQDRNEDRMRQRRGVGRDSKREKKRRRHWLLSWQFLSHGREDVSSHAPVVRLKNLGLLHSIQQSNSTHGCLVGRELVIPPSLHLPEPLLSTSLFPHHKHLHSVCFNNPVFPGHRVTRKQAAPFCSFCKTQVNTNGMANTDNSPGSVCIRRSILILKIERCPVKQNLVLPQCRGHSAGDRGEAPIWRKGNAQRSSDGLDPPPSVNWEYQRRARWLITASDECWQKIQVFLLLTGIFQMLLVNFLFRLLNRLSIFIWMKLYEPRTLAESVGGGWAERNALPNLLLLFSKAKSEYKVRHCFKNRLYSRGRLYGKTRQNVLCITSICSSNAALIK